MTAYRISQRHLLIALAVITLIKLFLAAVLPIRYDEWYYVQWGSHLSATYYDHPPMIGWVLHIMSYVSDHKFWYRLLPIASSLAATWFIYQWARQMTDEEGGRFAALLFIISPLNIILFIVTNDSPLLLLVILGVLAFMLAVKRESYLLAILCGVAFGLGLLTKYLIVVPAFGLIVYALMADQVKRVKLLFVVFLASLPFAAHHIYYNYVECWQTFHFHLNLRRGPSSWGGSVSGYLLEILLAFTPWALWFLWKARQSISGQLGKGFAVVSIASLLVMTVVSFRSIIGFHFLLMVAPFLFALFCFIQDDTARKWTLRLGYGYAVICLAALSALILVPWDRIDDGRYASDYVVATNPQAICDELEPYRDEPLFSYWYGSAAMLGYECERDIGLMFHTSRNGREFDKWTDLREYAGKNIVMIDLGDRDTSDRIEYFDNSRKRLFTVDDAPFTLFVGEGFNFEKYRQDYLSPLRERIYRAELFGVPAGSCSFNDRYFGDQ